MKVLVLGGAGYIGSHMCKYLAKQDSEVVVFDNLSTGHKEAVKWGTFIQGDILNKSDIKSVFDNFGPFDWVVHFCAKSLVGESVSQPAMYYQNNVVGTLNLLDVMVETGHDKLIFSSTAATYGQPDVDMIVESTPTKPINPYGKSKNMVELILEDYSQAYGLSSVCLRYFNACGADVEGDIGEAHEPETHLIPNILLSHLGKKEMGLKVFGTDYPTPDGTCVRDYVHVNDLAQAHQLAAEYLKQESGAHIFNLGNGQGFSVLDVINAAVRVVGEEIHYDVAERRGGDPAVLVADSTRARRVLGWKPEYTDIEDIISTAWNWHTKQSY